jgi:hypothetical protein
VYRALDRAYDAGVEPPVDAFHPRFNGSTATTTPILGSLYYRRPGPLGRTEGPSAELAFDIDAGDLSQDAEGLGRPWPTIPSDTLKFYKRLLPFLPRDVGAWDDSSNNKWLISGKER